MWNIKAFGMFKTKVKQLATAEFASNVTANIYLLLAI